MTPEEEARQGLVNALRVQSEKIGASDRLLSTQIAQAANEIETLADRLDFRLAERMGDKVSQIVIETISEEADGWEPDTRQPMYVSNDGFSFVIVDASPGGYEWHVQCQRKEKHG